MDLQLLTGFIGATLMLAFMPGPDNIYVLTESVAKGWKQGVGITCGLISGVLVHTMLVATGFSLVIFNYDWAYAVLKYVGSAYLLYLVYGAVKEEKIEIEIEGRSATEPFFRLFKRGFLMNVLNPKVTLFFMVLLPQFVSEGSGNWSPMSQMMVLGVVFMATSFPVFSSIALLAGKLSDLFRTDRFWIVTKWIKIAVLLALVALLLFSD